MRSGLAGGIVAATMPGSFILQSGDTPSHSRSLWPNSPGTKMTNGPKGQGNSHQREGQRRKAICKIRNLPWQTGSRNPCSSGHLPNSTASPWGSCRIHFDPATFDYFYDQMAFYCRRLLSNCGPEIRIYSVVQTTIQFRLCSQMWDRIWFP